jgi:predicted RNA binding protein YcfA (HicA-like mRNA interferase family)
MKVRDVLKRLNDEGWYLDRTRGDHRQFKHPDLTGRVTVSGHPSKDIPFDTLKHIYEQAGWGKP